MYSRAIETTRRGRYESRERSGAEMNFVSVVNAVAFVEIFEAFCIGFFAVSNVEYDVFQLRISKTHVRYTRLHLRNGREWGKELSRAARVRYRFGLQIRIVWGDSCAELLQRVFVEFEFSGETMFS